MKIFGVLMLATALTACASTPVFEVASNSCFGSTDATRYNRLWLVLRPDGTYAAELQGDITLWATSQGSWSETTDDILFAPTSHTGKEFLRQARKAHNGALAPLPIPNAYDYGWEPLKREACRSNTSFEGMRRPVTQFAVANWAPAPRTPQLDR
jgi:hypothetical protein